MLRRSAAPCNWLGMVMLFALAFSLGWLSSTFDSSQEPLEAPVVQPCPKTQPCPQPQPCPETQKPEPSDLQAKPSQPCSSQSYISREELGEIAKIGLVAADHTALYSKPVDLMIVWKHNPSDKGDFAKAYDIDPNEVLIYQKYLLPSLRKCKICANWFFSSLNIWDELQSPSDFQFLHNHMSMISVQHYQKHVLGYSNLTLFTSVDDTVSFNFWANLEAWIATKPSVEDGKEYCVYPRGQHFVFAFEDPPKCVPMSEIWTKEGLVLHLMIGIMSKKFYSPQYLDHAEFTSMTLYPNCVPTPIEGEAYYIRRRKSHSSLTHTTFYEDVLARARPCSYNEKLGQFVYG